MAQVSLTEISFLKKTIGPNPASLCLFSQYKDKYRQHKFDYEWTKGLNSVLGIRTPDGRMVGRDKIHWANCTLAYGNVSLKQNFYSVLFW